MASSSRAQSVDEALTAVIASLEKEQDLKKSLKEALEPVDEVIRTATAEIHRLHSAPSSSHQDIAKRAIDSIAAGKGKWLEVAKFVPAGEYHRYSWALGPPLRSLVTIVVFARFILTDELTPSFAVSDLIGLEQEGAESLTLLAEDYLQGVISMVNELPRLSVNSVTAQNFELPVKIASFVNDIFASYSLLNLRNDALRRKFDSLKYDLKRCEDVVYDLTLRGLTKPPSA
ncbi:Translin [Papiliotrema laurentii]|uniref:Translin n=1 Tax=Papiliotrema laurentii TaxID=5418 RepID=A0AAD9CRV4_PAPLA|nr:Translin [Papiliotrema laurentii]